MTAVPTQLNTKLERRVPCNSSTWSEVSSSRLERSRSSCRKGDNSCTCKVSRAEDYVMIRPTCFDGLQVGSDADLYIFKNLDMNHDPYGI